MGLTGVDGRDGNGETISIHHNDADTVKRTQPRDQLTAPRPTVHQVCGIPSIRQIKLLRFHLPPGVFPPRHLYSKADLVNSTWEPSLAIGFLSGLLACIVSSTTIAFRRNVRYRKLPTR
jgi:hypothetical protein